MAVRSGWCGSMSFGTAQRPRVAFDGVTPLGNS